MIESRPLVGFARSTMTPPVGLPYLSHWPRQGVFVDVADELTARAVTISDRGRTVALLSCDLIGIGRGLLAGSEELVQAVRREVHALTGLPSGAVLVSATHAHSTPDTSGITDIRWNKLAADWLDSLPTLLAHTVAEALAASVQADLRSGMCLADDFAAIRRVRPVNGHPGPFSGAPDRSVTVLVAGQSSGRTVAVINYACHPVLLQAQSSVSADFPGAALRLLEEAGIDALYLQGACGDVNPAKGDAGEWADVVEDGHTLANAAGRAIRGATPIRMADMPVDWRSAMLEVPKRPVPPTHRQSWARALANSSDPARARPAADLLSLVEKLGNTDVSWQAEVQVLRIGDLAVAALPGELFTALGLLIKSMSPASRTLIAGYANDYLGYLAPPWEWVDGGYEVASGPWSLVSGEGALRLTDAALDLLWQIWDDSNALAPGAHEREMA